jgi:hypothetical protein
MKENWVLNSVAVGCIDESRVMIPSRVLLAEFSQLKSAFKLEPQMGFATLSDLLIAVLSDVSEHLGCYWSVG